MSNDIIFLLGPLKKKFVVSSFLLCLSSPVLRKEWENKSNVVEIVLNNIETESMKIIVNFISGKETEAIKQLTEETVCEILNFSQQFQIYNLHKLATNFLFSIITPKNLIDFYRFALKAKDQSIEVILWNWLVKKGGKVKASLTNDIFFECNEQQLSNLLQQNFCAVDEDLLFNAMLHWIKKQITSTNEKQRTIREILEKIIPYIRFPLMRESFLANEVYNSGILTNEELVNVFRAKTLKNDHLTHFKNEKRLNKIQMENIKDEKDDDNIVKTEITGVSCINDSGTFAGWPTTNMLSDNDGYWCSSSLGGNTT
ncbi:hypothetical protein RFI_03900, partial [Reticulomyxa filosa]